MSIEKPCTHQERIKIEGNKPSTGFEAGARVHGSRSWTPPVGRAVRNYGAIVRAGRSPVGPESQVALDSGGGNFQGAGFQETVVICGYY